ncbi:hypothetical protein [Aestuariivivens insulae]|uniref:hypothetical protein n=1 Tax=Aestuariivivens insulae TaxID=1621988 RepID=UPI001F58F397|nr:hypothetical protein [Aestuariivivens insulae]
MNKNKNYILIVLGVIVAFYGEVSEAQSPYILIGGIIMLMVGVYRISKTIPSKRDKEVEQDKSGEIEKD